MDSKLTKLIFALLLITISTSYADSSGSPIKYHFRGFDAKTATSVNLTFHIKNKNHSPFYNQMIIDSFVLTHGSFSCQLKDQNNTSGELSTISVNFMPFSWKGSYGEVKGKFTMPSTPYGPSTIQWENLTQDNCTFPHAQVKLFPDN